LWSSESFAFVWPNPPYAARTLLRRVAEIHRAAGKYPALLSFSMQSIAASSEDIKGVLIIMSEELFDFFSGSGRRHKELFLKLNEDDIDILKRDTEEFEFTENRYKRHISGVNNSNYRKIDIKGIFPDLT
jgi:hypothetical protein